MIYLKCPTCGYILGNRQKLYDIGLEEIESNPNNDEETKLNEIVVSASRTPERVIESPVTIERMGLQQIKNSTGRKTCP